jgi:aspartate/methionine/tyrosine aminotransferase
LDWNFSDKALIGNTCLSGRTFGIRHQPGLRRTRSDINESKSRLEYRFSKGRTMAQATPTPLALSPHIGGHLTLSPTLRINEKVKEMWAAGQEVYHLGFGESRFPVHPRIAQALQENVHHKSYLPAQGIPELRERIADFYTKHFHVPTTPDRVMVGPGSKALIYALLSVLDGDLILPTPSWVSYEPQARLLGKPVRRIPSSPATGHALTVHALDQTVKPSEQSQHILLVNSPNNPTGQMFSPAFVSELAAYCRAEQIVVLSDEIYGLTGHGRVAHHSMARAYPEGTVVLGGLSKHLSLGGWRVGVAVLPEGPAGERLMTALRMLAGELWSCVAAPIQHAAVVAYSEEPEIQEYIRECARIHALRTHYLWEKLTELDIPCAEPSGGFYLFANFDQWQRQLAARGIHTSGALAEYLLEEFQIATLPGEAFGTPPNELSLRLSSSYVDMETDAKAQAILEAFRSGMDGETLMATRHPAMNEAIRRFRRFIETLYDTDAS